jgi:uncharacterized protein (TIGR02646 family)
MRYINLDRLNITSEWLEKAQKAYEYVKGLPPEKRAEAINGRSQIWKELKDELKRISYGKCWYCESSEIRGDKAVDHYRPKNEIIECPNHNGYWWLAFNWRNFRYSCQYCNEIRIDRNTNIPGGKSSHFPLLDPKRRVFDESDPYAILAEQPLLLDPTEADDPQLLTFNTDGTAQAACMPKDDLEDYQRAQMSIECYHLNHTDLKERRQVCICNKMKQLVDEGNMYRSFLEKNRSDTAALQGYKRVVKGIREMIHESAEYSAAARAMLKIYRNWPWIDTLCTAS